MTIRERLIKIREKLNSNFDEGIQLLSELIDAMDFS